jgi:hypothetical protein
MTDHQLQHSDGRSGATWWCTCGAWFWLRGVVSVDDSDWRAVRVEFIAHRINGDLKTRRIEDLIRRADEYAGDDPDKTVRYRSKVVEMLTEPDGR